MMDAERLERAARALLAYFDQDGECKPHFYGGTIDALRAALAASKPAQAGVPCVCGSADRTGNDAAHASGCHFKPAPAQAVEAVAWAVRDFHGGDCGLPRLDRIHAEEDAKFLDTEGPSIGPHAVVPLFGAPSRPGGATKEPAQAGDAVAREAVRFMVAKVTDVCNKIDRDLKNCDGPVSERRRLDTLARGAMAVWAALDESVMREAVSHALWAQRPGGAAAQAGEAVAWQIVDHNYGPTHYFGMTEDDAWARMVKASGEGRSVWAKTRFARPLYAAPSRPRGAS